MKRMHTIWFAVLLTMMAGCDDTGPLAPDGLNESVGASGGPASGVVMTSPGEASAHDGHVSQELASRWIRHAQRLFGRAQSLAGPDPEPPISAWLQAAEQMLSQAVSSFESGNYQAAVSQAQSSAEKSQQVIDALWQAPQGPDPEVAAQHAIQQAQALLDRAVELAGDEPSERIRQALHRASVLLGAAREAYGAGDYREAVRLARESGGISSRVIRILAG